MGIRVIFFLDTGFLNQNASFFFLVAFSENSLFQMAEGTFSKPYEGVSSIELPQINIHGFTRGEGLVRILGWHQRKPMRR